MEAGLLARQATSSVTQNATHTTTSATHAATTSHVANQAGILQGLDPTVYTPSNPTILFIIQSIIIIAFCRLCYWPCAKLRQPRVIAEVIGGILLGPSVMGHIPGFTKTIFPAASIPALTNTANLGLIFFLFLVGLEVDTKAIVKHWRIATTVSVASMLLPFGLGCAVAYGIYYQFRHEPGTVIIKFPVYMLFVGVAMAITAFPVLCRILTECRLLNTPVGVITLSAGVGNDIVGWVLLALCIALVNAGTGLVALWVLLCSVGWTVFLFLVVRPALMWILKRSGSLDNGPSQGIVCLTIVIIFASSFFTGVIGVHVIFGAFLAGLIFPHDGGFAIKLSEKIEDFNGAFLLPVFFGLFGLNTNLGLLDNGITWAYLIAITVAAFFGKVIAAAIAARLSGSVWRESFAIAALMSCKGVVELIVLNIGLQAKILSTRVFTIFVVMTLVITCATTPLTLWLYPVWYREKLELWKAGKIDWDTGDARQGSDDSGSDADNWHPKKDDTAPFRKFLVYLRLEGFSGTLSLFTLLGHEHSASASDEGRDESRQRDSINAHGMRLLALADRDSSVMQQVVEYNSAADPVVDAFNASASLNNITISGEVATVLDSQFSGILTSKARESASDFLFIPWSHSGSLSDTPVSSDIEDPESTLWSSPFSQFVRSTFEGCADSNSVGVLVKNGLKADKASRTRIMSILMYYSGSIDDRAAVRLAMQLIRKDGLRLEIVHHTNDRESSDLAKEKELGEKDTVVTVTLPTDQRPPRDSVAFLNSLRDTLPSDAAARVTITAIPSGPADTIASALLERATKPRDLIILGRNVDVLPRAPVRNPSLRRSSLVGAMSLKSGEQIQESTTLGDIAERILLRQIRDEKAASLMVVQGRRFHESYSRRFSLVEKTY